MVLQRHIQGMNRYFETSHTLTLPTGNIVNLALERYLRGIQTSLEEGSEQSVLTPRLSAEVIDFCQRAESVSRAEKDKNILTLLDALKEDV